MWDQLDIVPRRSEPAAPESPRNLLSLALLVLAALVAGILTLFI